MWDSFSIRQDLCELRWTAPFGQHMNCCWHYIANTRHHSHAVEVSNLASSHSNITSRHVSLWANVSGQLKHEALTEPHNLVVRLAVGVKVTATLRKCEAR